MRKKEYKDIIFEDKLKNNKEDIIIDGINFKDVLFHKIMDYLGYEIPFNTEEQKSKKVIFYTSCVQSHMEDILKDYFYNNCSKLFLELIKDT